jgi:hypothetical protein
MASMKLQQRYRIIRPPTAMHANQFLVYALLPETLHDVQSQFRPLMILAMATNKTVSISLQVGECLIDNIEVT